MAERLTPSSARASGATNGVWLGGDADRVWLGEDADRVWLGQNGAGDEPCHQQKGEGGGSWGATVILSLHLPYRSTVHDAPFILSMIP